MRFTPYSGSSNNPQYKVYVDMKELREQFYSDAFRVDPGYDHSGIPTIFNDLVAMALGIQGHPRARLQELPRYFSTQAQESGDVQKLLDRTWVAISTHAARVEQHAFAGTGMVLSPSRTLPTTWVPDLVTLYYEPQEVQPQPEEPVDDQPLTEEEIIEEEDQEAFEEELQSQGILVNPADAYLEDNVSAELSKWGAAIMMRNMRSIHDVIREGGQNVEGHGCTSDEDLAQRLVTMGTQELAGESERVDNDPLGMGQRKF